MSYAGNTICRCCSENPRGAMKPRMLWVRPARRTHSPTNRVAMSSTANHSFSFMVLTASLCSRISWTSPYPPDPPKLRAPGISRVV
ncbi:TPA_asm: UL13.5 |nr:TPA_asm: UL13.5 \